MKLIEKLLPVNEYSRPGRRLGAVKAIIMHWTGAPGQKASETWKFFADECCRTKHYSSAHYIVDIGGDVYHAIPDNEVAYHCGSSMADPASGRIYTDWARAKFGAYAENPSATSPNNCTIGIEMCVISNSGVIDNSTLDSAAQLVAKLCRKHQLMVDDIGTHYGVVGWKLCPLLWAKEPRHLAEFRVKVKGLLGV